MSECCAGAVDTCFFVVFVRHVWDEKLSIRLYSQGKHVECLGSEN